MAIANRLKTAISNKVLTGAKTICQKSGPSVGFEYYTTTRKNGPYWQLVYYTSSSFQLKLQKSEDLLGSSSNFIEIMILVAYHYPLVSGCDSASNFLGLDIS
jgi:hypothetical protein